jgi:hypothetical protein
MQVENPNNATTAKWLHQAANAINLAHDTREYTPNWDAWTATLMPHPARTLNHDYHEKRQANLLTRITDIERAVHRSMGQEGGHFLEPPPDAPLYMPDDHYRMALQRRLLAPINSSTTQCRNRNDAQTCNHATRDNHHHT